MSTPVPQQSTHSAATTTTDLDDADLDRADLDHVSDDLLIEDGDELQVAYMPPVDPVVHSTFTIEGIIPFAQLLLVLFLIISYIRSNGAYSHFSSNHYQTNSLLWKQIFKMGIPNPYPAVHLERDCGYFNSIILLCLYPIHHPIHPE